MKQTSNPSPVPGNMLDILDQTFLRHFLRITGAREGIHGLSMDLVSVACIVLLAEGSGESDDARERPLLSREDLKNKLVEMGLDDPERLGHTLESMVRTGYVQIDDRGDLAPGKATLSMAALLDRAFPGMPGMNLVAYFIQTLDEVESGRKGPREALSQLDQMLRRHGSAPLNRKAQSGRSKPPSPLRPARAAIRRAPRPRPDRLELPKNPAPSLPRESWDAEPSSQEALHAEEPSVPDLPAAPPLSEAEPATETTEASEEPPAEAWLPPEEPPSPAEILEVPPASEPAPSPGPPSKEPDPGPAEDILRDAPAPVPNGAEPLPRVEAVSGVPGNGTQTAAAPEESVEDRIAVFEEELSMQCPLCRKASIQGLQTAKGRTYYKCSDEMCMFISWGRPHHIPCPLCGNPFLVETAGRDDGGTLKCPRATCRYRGSDPGAGTPPPAPEGVGASPGSDKKARRRVVRRKVRRKRR